MLSQVMLLLPMIETQRLCYHSLSVDVISQDLLKLEEKILVRRQKYV